MIEFLECDKKNVEYLFLHLDYTPDHYKYVNNKEIDNENINYNEPYENKIIKLLLNNFNTSEDDSTNYVLSNGLEKLEESKLNFKPNSNSNNTINNKFIIVCKCITLDKLITKITDKNFTDKSLNDIINLNTNYSQSHIIEFPIDSNRSVFLYKNKSLLLPEFLIQYDYTYTNPLGISIDSDNHSTTNSDLSVISSSYTNKIDFNQESINLFNLCSKKMYFNYNEDLILKSFDQNIYQKHTVCNFSDREELESTALFFCKSSIIRFLSKCFKYGSIEDFEDELDKIKEKTEEINSLNFKYNHIENIISLQEINPSLTIKSINLFNCKLDDTMLIEFITNLKMGKNETDLAPLNSNIEEIKLSCNNLKIINLDLFSNSNFPNLSILDLAHNSIEKIIYSDEDKILREKYIKENDTNVKTIFNKFKQIKNLDVSFNSLKDFRIIYTVISYLELESFNFIGNPFPKEFLFLFNGKSTPHFNTNNIFKNKDILSLLNSKLNIIESKDLNFSLNLALEDKLINRSNLKQFDILYETFSFSKSKKYQSVAENNYLFKGSVNKEKASLMLLKKKFNKIPIFVNSINNEIQVLYSNLNKIVKIENIEVFINLEELYLQNNKINKLENLKLINLIKLDISNNLLNDIEGVSQMKKLQWLNIESNLIRGLNTNELVLLDELIELHSSGNCISNLKECLELKRVPKLQNLDLSNNDVCRNISDFRFYIINYFSKLQILNKIIIEKSELIQAREYFDGKITSELLETKLGVIKISNLSYIEEIILTNSKLKDSNSTNDFFFDQSVFINLKKLDLSRNCLSSFKVIGTLPTLTALYLNSNLFEKILGNNKNKQIPNKGINGLINLETLEICDNSLVELNGINSLKNLRNLVLRQNNINKIDNIDSMPNLVFLDISFNKLRNVEKSNVGNIPQIKTLICDSNFLKNINAFCKLNNLLFASFDNNKISDFNNIEKLTNIENLKELNLNNNPITKTLYYRSNIVKKFLSINKVDNVDVSKEERDFALMELQMNDEGYCDGGFNNIPNADKILYNSNSNQNNNQNLKTIKLQDKFPGPMKVNLINLDLMTGMLGIGANYVNKITNLKNESNYINNINNINFSFSRKNKDFNLPIIANKILVSTKKQIFSRANLITQISKDNIINDLSNNSNSMRNLNTRNSKIKVSGQMGKINNANNYSGNCISQDQGNAFKHKGEMISNGYQNYQNQNYPEETNAYNKRITNKTKITIHDLLNEDKNYFSSQPISKK